ncbi:hypothetical protein HZZ00_35275 [Streptomyces sp. NEAU-sy36]|uniref:hypothetical protein n=1 Tax=unclassified Streptomyces TaxID=2593676 RepID=UPI0015D5F6BC|nr:MULTISPECIES: hypothetical protein [unclassified Streptomyces]QLJ05768.1 hypothetical protein HZZ00_35275 [Streptomyces sp. NEAU-sy36]
MPIEEDFTEALRITLQAFEPPNTHALLQGGVHSGRRRRRRRALAIGVSGAAVLALVGLGATIASGQLSGGRTADQTLTGPAASSTTGSATASATPEPTFTGTLPPARALATLTALLPTGLSHSGPPGGERSGQLWVDDGHGKSLLEVHVSRQTSTAAVRGHVFAGTTPSADGTLIKTTQSPPGPGPGHQTVNVLHPDGLYVTITEWQAPSQNALSTRTTPILTTTRLRAIATSPQWR